MGVRSAQYLVKKFLGAYRRLNKSRQQKNIVIISIICLIENLFLNNSIASTWRH